MKKTLFTLFFLITISLIAILFFNVSSFKRYDICIVFTESGGDTIKNLPFLKTAMNEVLSECEGTPVLIESGSIFQTKENLVFYENGTKGTSPAVKFLENNSYDFTAFTPMALQISPERLKSELKNTDIKILTVNADVLNTDGLFDLNGVTLFFASYISDKGSRYLDADTRKKWNVEPPFVIEEHTRLKTEKSVGADMKIAVFSEYDDIPFLQDDFSEAMVYFHNVMPSLNIFVTDSKDFTEKMNLRESLVVKTTSKVPSIIVAEYSLILNEDKRSVATVKKDIKTLSLNRFKADGETEKLIEPYIVRYNDHMNKESDQVPYEINCKHPGKEECLMDRLYSIALKEAASECSSGVDFTISFPVSNDVSIERGKSITRKYIGTLFPLKEKSVVLNLIWEQITEI
ncbi:MAG TPA: hypothetical protein ENN58_00200, partial [bacterium]|nr:hypothetical protein [bacterium]